MTTLTTAKNARRAVDRRSGTANHLDALDRARRNREVLADVGGVVHRLVEAVAVDEHEDARVVVAGPAEAAHAKVAVVAIVRDVEAADAAQHVAERSVSEALDFLVCDDAHRRRRVDDALAVARRPEHGAHLDAQELFDRQLRDRLVAFVCAPAPAGAIAHAAATPQRTRLKFVINSLGRLCLLPPVQGPDPRRAIGGRRNQAGLSRGRCGVRWRTPARTGGGATTHSSSEGLRPSDSPNTISGGRPSDDANERQRVSLASGAAPGAPASEPVGESQGRSPSAN